MCFIDSALWLHISYSGSSPSGAENRSAFPSMVRMDRSKLAFLEDLPSECRHWAKYFTCIITLNPHSIPTRWQGLSPSQRSEETEAQRCCLPKLLCTGGVKIQTKAILFTLYRDASWVPVKWMPLSKSCSDFFLAQVTEEEKLDNNHYYFENNLPHST